MKLWKSALAATVILTSTTANAALIERLGGLAYYDDVADLTWLADANVAGSVGSWEHANNWAASLIVDGVDGWRLADVNPVIESNQTDSEFGNLFYNVLGGSAGTLISASHNANYDLFSNVQDYLYWSANEFDLNYYGAWYLNMQRGGKVDTHLKTTNMYAWAVHSGDVSAVPVPAAVWLFGSGLIGLVGFARRKKA